MTVVIHFDIFLTQHFSTQEHDITAKWFKKSSSGFLSLFQGQGWTTFEKNIFVSAILFPRWLPPIFKACVHSKSGPIVFKLCIVIDITHGRMPTDCVQNSLKNMATRGDFVKPTLSMQC